MSKPRKSSSASRSSRPTTTTQRWRSPVRVRPDTRSRSANSRATHKRAALQKHLTKRNEKMTESIRSAKSTTRKAAKKGDRGKSFKGFTEEERMAMKEYLQEKKVAARRGRRADKEDG